MHFRSRKNKLTFNRCFPRGGLSSPYVVGNTFSSDDTFKSTSKSPAEQNFVLINYHFLSSTGEGENYPLYDKKSGN